MFGARSEKVSAADWYLGDNASAIAWSPDSRHVAAALASGKIKVIDTKADDTVVRLDGHKFGAMGIAWSPDGAAIMTAGQDGTARLYDVSTSSLVKTLQCGSQWVEHVAWSPDGRHVATAAGKTLCMWTDRGEPVFEYKDHRSTVSAMQWQYAGDRVATACYGAVSLFSPQNPEPYQKLECASSLISLAWSPSTKHIVAGTQEATVNFWKPPFEDGKYLEMRGYETKVKELAWDRKSQFLATGGGSQVTVWDADSELEGSTPKALRHLYRVTQLTFQRSGDLLASGSKEGFVTVWNARESDTPVWEKRLAGDVLVARWSPDDSALAVCTADGRMSVLEAPARQ